ncbi:hypothetical protein ACFL3G_01750 [Planctomycetota bacterium]
MSDKKRASQRMRCNKFSGPEAKVLEIPGHHLICAVCRRGGCKTPPPGKGAIDRLLKAMWAYPYVGLKITADVDIISNHFFDVYEKRGKKPLSKNFKTRSDNYVWRRKDLEVCRVLGIIPNTVIPAYFVYSVLFERQPTLDGICRTGSKKSKTWPQCPHATKGYYEKIANGPKFNLQEQTQLGEEMEASGLWAMIRPRSKQDMAQAKKNSARNIINKAEHLYIRPQHLLCILCTAQIKEPLIQDNLIELRKRMEENPNIPVTICEGCCMACDSCNIYHPDEHLCYGMHIKNSLRGLMILERLGLAPGATMPAAKLYKRIYERIGTLKEICGWRDGSDTAMWWAPCLDYQSPVIEEARRKGLISKKPAVSKAKKRQ